MSKKRRQHKLAPRKATRDELEQLRQENAVLRKILSADPARALAALVEQNRELKALLDEWRNFMFSVLPVEFTKTAAEYLLIHDVLGDTADSNTPEAEQTETPEQYLAVAATIWIYQQSATSCYHLPPTVFPGNFNEFLTEVPHQVQMALSSIPSPADLPTNWRVLGLSDVEIGEALHQLTYARKISQEQFKKCRLELWYRFQDQITTSGLDQPQARFFSFVDRTFERFDRRLKDIKPLFYQWNRGK